MRKRAPRGLTFVTVLIVIGAVAGIGWIVTYGPAYWENTDVTKMMHEAANLCYREPSDDKVRIFVINGLHQLFDIGERDVNGDQIMRIDFQPEDLRIDRSDSPKAVNIWLTYSRTVKMPMVGQERQVTFVDHVEQDLSPVKW
jgi:hypothetical protein